MIGGTIPGYDSYESTVDSASSDEPANMIDGTDMLYSSGTTGMPKGVARPFPGTPLGTASGLSQLLTVGLYGFSDAMVYLSPAPLYHAAPLRFNMSVHGIGGTMGAILTGVFADEKVNAVLGKGGMDLLPGLLGNQLKAVALTIVWSVVATAILAYIVKFTVGLRPSEEDERTGLDLAEHGEEGYHG